MNDAVSRAVFDRAVTIATVALDAVDSLNAALLQVAAAAGVTVPAEQLAIATEAVQDYRQELAILAADPVAGGAVH